MVGRNALRLVLLLGVGLIWLPAHAALTSPLTLFPEVEPKARTSTYLVQALALLAESALGHALLTSPDPDAQHAVQVLRHLEDRRLHEASFERQLKDAALVGEARLEVEILRDAERLAQMRLGDLLVRKGRVLFYGRWIWFRALPKIAGSIMAFDAVARVWILWSGRDPGLQAGRLYLPR